MIKLLMTVMPLIGLCSCFSKKNNEISEMVETCFKHRQSIRIEFTPSPEMDHEGKEEKLK